jgi:hypothetical protein
MMHNPDGELTLVFIMGDVRSGSTVLSVVLGNHPQIESVGELPRWPAFRGCPKEGNQKVEDHEFWRLVREAYSDPGPPFDFSRLATVEEAVEAHHNFWKLLLGRLDPALEAEYKQHLLRLLEAIRSVSDKNVILDSAKKPARAYMLLRCPGLRVRIIHLVRDPRGSLWSQMKRDVEQKHKRPYVALLHYSIKNTMSEIVRISAPSDTVLRVRYEDLALQPVREFERIGRFMDLSMEPVIARLEAGQPFAVPHLIDGNRIRREQQIQLQLDGEWQERLSRKHRLLSALLTFPLFVAYGYWNYANCDRG